MQESIYRGQKLQFQTFGTSLYSTAHPSISLKTLKSWVGNPSNQIQNTGLES